MTWYYIILYCNEKFIIILYTLKDTTNLHCYYYIRIFGNISLYQGIYIVLYCTTCIGEFIKFLLLLLLI